MKNTAKKLLCVLLCACLLSLGAVSVFAENVDEAWDVGENYVFYGTYISSQGGEYELSALYDYTVFGFAPEETGKYEITVENGLVGIVSYNGMWMYFDPSADNVSASTTVWECTGVGQEIWVAVISDDAVANITVKAEESQVIVVEKIVYENKTTPTACDIPLDFEKFSAVSTMNTKVDTAVLGEDGYYHLNSADGYILYANLSDTLMSLYTVSQTGQLKGAIRNEDGKVTAIIDYNIAFGEYYECADPETLLYPLTDDLIEMFKEVGDNMGWYGEEGWVGGKYDDAWMFACYYTEEPMYTHKIGDVNLDGAINAIDANILSRMVSGRIATPSAGEEKYVVDVNSDGKINALDGNMLKRLISGAIEL